MTAAFKKGQEVTFIGDYNRKGTVYFFHAIVHSCGKKQMVLTDAKTGQERGRHFAPKAGSLESTIENNVYFPAGGTFPRLNDEELQKAAMQIAASLKQSEINHLKHCLTIGVGGAYDEGIRQSLAEVEAHEMALIER